MLLVKTVLNNSNIHGIGLFADQDISKGETIWKLHPSTCSIFSYQEFLSLCKSIPLVGITNFLQYSYLKNNQVYYLSDNSKFINHSLDANIGFSSDCKEVALRDISKGEELLENYIQSYDVNDFFMQEHLFELQSKKKVLKSLGGLLAYYNNLPRQI